MLKCVEASLFVCDRRMHWVDSANERLNLGLHRLLTRAWTQTYQPAPYLLFACVNSKNCLFSHTHTRTHARLCVFVCVWVRVCVWRKCESTPKYFKFYTKHNTTIHYCQSLPKYNSLGDELYKLFIAFVQILSWYYVYCVSCLFVD